MNFIRHSIKSYKNNKSSEYSLDPPLTDEGETFAHTKFQTLIDTYGIPTKIISSPYLRVRQTASILQKILKNNYDIDIEIIYEPLIGEFFTSDKYNVEYINENLRASTLEHHLIYPESWQQYTSRIRKFKNNLMNILPNENIWIITHGVVISSMAHVLFSEKYYPNPMCGFHISIHDYKHRRNNKIIKI